MSEREITTEDLADAEEMARLISRFPADKRVGARIMSEAYMQGLASAEALADQAVDDDDISRGA